jgi:hypothetical protein
MIDLVDSRAGLEGLLKPPRSRRCVRADGGGDSDGGGEVKTSEVLSDHRAGIDDRSG